MPFRSFALKFLLEGGQPLKAADCGICDPRSFEQVAEKAFERRHPRDMRTAGMPLTIFSVKGRAGVKHVRAPHEALIAVEARGIVRALMPSGFERSVGFGPDARLVRSHFYPKASARSGRSSDALDAVSLS